MAQLNDGQQPVQLVVGTANSSPDAYQFVASLVGSLAWPIAVVAICLVFKTQIGGLLDRIRRAKIGSAVDISLAQGEVQLEIAEAVAPPNIYERAAAAGMAIDQAPPGLTQAGLAREEALRDLEDAPIDPAEIIERLWRIVEQTVRETANRLGVPGEQINKPVFALGKHMKGQELFTAQIMGLLAELRKVRNLANHGEAVSRDAAQRYFRLTVRLIGLLEGL